MKHRSTLRPRPSLRRNAIARYVRRYADTLWEAGWSNDPVWVEVRRLLEAVRDEVLRARQWQRQAIDFRGPKVGLCAKMRTLPHERSGFHFGRPRIAVIMHERRLH